MASCDDDFGLLPDENSQPPPHHHHHCFSHHHDQHYVPHCYCTDPSPITVPSHTAPSIVDNSTDVVAAAPTAISGMHDDEVVSGEYRGSSFCTQERSKCLPVFHEMSHFSGGEDSNTFGEEDARDPEKIAINLQHNECRKDRDEHSDGATVTYSYKKSRVSGSAAMPVIGGGEYRKDREEWSDTAIGSLLDAYTEKFTLLNRGNLRGRDWESVAATVSDRSENQTKTVEQCKNKVDNLKKRYKLERQRMINGGHLESHWPWFKQMEQIVGNPWQGKALVEESLASSSMIRQSKRYTIPMPNHVLDVNNIKSKSLISARWRRVVFRISGVALAGERPHNFDPRVAMLIAEEVAIACRLGVEVAIVVGGGNFFCCDSWVEENGLDRSTANRISMMATVMNSILLQSSLEKLGLHTRIQTTFLQELAEPYCRLRAIRHLQKGRVLIFAGVGPSSGNPLFSTDTAAALRASEINAEAVVKGVNREGDVNAGAGHISFRELASTRVTSIDIMALSICEENGISVVVFNVEEEGGKVISRALCGEKVGTLIDQTGGGSSSSIAM